MMPAAPGEMSESRAYADALREISLRYERLLRDISILSQIDEFADPSLDFPEICTRLVEIIASGLAVENCSLVMLDDREEFLEIRAASSPFDFEGRYFASGEWTGAKFRLNEGILGKVVHTGKPIRIDDVSLREDFVPVRNSPVVLRSLMCFPIQVQGKTIGALNLSHSSPGFFNVESEKTLELVANRAGHLLASHFLLRQLRDAEQYHRLLMNNAADVILAFDPDGGVLSVNPPVETITGVPFDAYAQQKVRWDAGVYPDDLDQFIEHRQSVLTSLATKTFEYRYRDAGGAIHYLEERSSAMRDANGNCTGVVSIIRDQTERYLAEKEHRRLVTAIEQVAESVVITDSSGAIEYVNPAFERITGYLRDDVLGQNPRMLKSGKQDDALYAQLWQTITSGNVWSGHVTNRKKDGSLFEEEMTISPVRNQGGAITNFVAVKRDVTELVALENQLRQAQKMEAIGQLAGGVAHDFNNLLQAIQGFSELALNKLPQEHESRLLLGEVLSATDRASSLTRQLLMFSRREALQPKDINLNATISDMVKMVRRIIGEHIELDVLSEPNLKTVHADEGQIGQVLVNLCVNARDAMPEGGRLTIKTSNEVFDEFSAGIYAGKRIGDFVCVSVTDTGIGMSVQTQARIFEPFFTTKELGKGTGMGLATVYGIIEQHGGMLSVESEERKGTTFRFWLPAVSGNPVVTPAKTARAVVPAQNKTILLAEDESSVRGLVTRILTDFGYSVLSACDGEETMAVFRQNADIIDLAILDVVMPRMSGRTVCEQIRILKPDLPILFSSGYSLDLLNQEFLAETGTLCIQKPYTPGDLLQMVEAALSKSQCP